MLPIVLLSVLLLFCPARAAAWTSKVVEVISGDSLVVLAHGNEVRVRLYGIRTPALGAKGGRRAREVTASLLRGGLVSVDLYEVEEGGVVLALVSSDGRIINKELLTLGFARVNREKCRAYFCDSWLAVEKEAEERRLGLWGQKEEPIRRLPFNDEDNR